METRIPYPIPEPERGELIAAGVAACRVPLKSKARAMLSARVQEVIDRIARKYGVQVQDHTDMEE